MNVITQSVRLSKWLIIDATREGLPYMVALSAVFCVFLAIHAEPVSYAGLMQSFPLVLFFYVAPSVLCAGIIANDIEKGRVLLLFSAGLSKTAFLASKYMTGTAVAWIVCLPPVMVALILNKEFRVSTFGTALWISFSLALGLAGSVALLMFLSTVIQGTRNAFYRLVISIVAFALYVKWTLDGGDMQTAHPILIRVFKLVLMSPYSMAGATAVHGVPSWGDIVVMVASTGFFLGLAAVAIGGKELAMAISNE